MTVERVFEFDKDTKLLKVRAITEDSYSEESVLNIYRDNEIKLKQAIEALEDLKKLDFALKSIEKDSRLKQIVETVLLFAKFGKIPTREELSLDLRKENILKAKATFEKDLTDLKPFIEKKFPI